MANRSTFTTKPKKITQDGELAWGGESGWSDEIAENTGVAIGETGMRPSAIPTEGLVSQWKFNGDAIDSAGSNDGAASGDVTYVEGKKGQAISLTADSEVRVPHDTTLDITDTVTVSAWVNASVLPESMESGYPMIMNKGGGGDTGAYTFGVLKSGTNQMGFRISTGSDFVDTRYELTSTSWVHIVGTYDGSFIRIYENGVQQSETETSVQINSNTADITIGKTAWEGLVDDLLLYNRPFDSSTASTVYEATA